MGDRANVYVKGADDVEGVYLYTHWEGTELPYTLQQALARKERWDDNAYLARIIFCEMIKGQEDMETGYGISASVCDGGDRVLVVDPNTQTVSVDGNAVSFEAFVNLSNPTWESLRRVVAEDDDGRLTSDQRAALFASFSEVFGDLDDERRYAFTRLVLGHDNLVSWSSRSPDWITAGEASKVLDALDALSV